MWLSGDGMGLVMVERVMGGSDGSGNGGVMVEVSVG